MNYTHEHDVTNHPGATEEGEVPSGDWLAARNPWTIRAVVGAVLVAAAVCVVTIWLRTEIVGTDPWRYVQSARDFPDDSWVPLGYTRYGMILPLIPLDALFGNSAVVYYFWPVVGSGLLAAGLFLIGYRFWGRTIGLLAVLLGFVSPITFINMSRGYPDVQSTGVFVTAVVLAFVIRDRLGEGRHIPWALWLGIGLLLGWAFEARETTILVWPIVVLVLWRRDLGLRALGWRGPALLAGGLAAWALTDIIIGAVGYGDALMRVHAFTRQDLATAVNPADLAAREEFVGRSRLFYLSVIPTMLLTEIRGGIWTILLAGLGLIGLAFRGGARFVAIWMTLAYITFVGITGFFFPDHPSGRIDIQRYWISFLPMVGLAAAGAVGELAAVVQRLVSDREPRARQLTHRAFVVAISVLVLLGPMISLTVYASRNPQLSVNGANQMSQLRLHFSESNLPADQRIFTDTYTGRLLPIYQRSTFGGTELWHADIVHIASKKTKPKPGDFVIINSLSNSSCPFCQTAIKEWYAKNGPLPDNWQEVWASKPRNLVVYEVS